MQNSSTRDTARETWSHRTWGGCVDHRCTSPGHSAIYTQHPSLLYRPGASWHTEEEPASLGPTADQQWGSLR